MGSSVFAIEGFYNSRVKCVDILPFWFRVIPLLFAFCMFYAVTGCALHSVMLLTERINDFLWRPSVAAFMRAPTAEEAARSESG